MRYDESPDLVLSDLATHNSFEAFSFFLRATLAHTRTFVATFISGDENVRDVLGKAYLNFWLYRHNIVDCPSDGFDFFIELIGEAMEYSPGISISLSYSSEELAAFACVSDYSEIVAYYCLNQDDRALVSLLDIYIVHRIAQLPPSQLLIFELMGVCTLSEISMMLQENEDVVSNQYVKALISVFVDREIYRANEFNQRFEQ